jgi:hypothetical protein
MFRRKFREDRGEISGKEQKSFRRILREMEVRRLERDAEKTDEMEENLRRDSDRW